MSKFERNLLAVLVVIGFVSYCHHFHHLAWIGVATYATLMIWMASKRGNYAMVALIVAILSTAGLTGWFMMNGNVLSPLLSWTLILSAMLGIILTLRESARRSS